MATKAKADRSGRFVGVISHGVRDVHMAGFFGTYATACGLDGSDDDEHVQQEMSEVQPGELITCPDCWRLWETMLLYKRSDFTPALRT